MLYNIWAHLSALSHLQELDMSEKCRHLPHVDGFRMNRGAHANNCTKENKVLITYTVESENICRESVFGGAVKNLPYSGKIGVIHRLPLC